MGPVSARQQSSGRRFRSGEPPRGAAKLPAVQRVFVGDVQGCADELREVVDRAEARFEGRYELWLVGDLVNRGPKSLEVLERVRALWEDGRACPVLGNHELSLLRLELGLREEARDDTFQEVLAAPDGSRWTAWIRSWPLVRRGRLGTRPFAMVHAAAGPGWSLDELSRRAAPLETRLRASAESARALLAAGRRDEPAADDLERMTRCRSAAPDGTWASAAPDDPGAAWHAAWQAARPEYALVYGHWALQGLHETGSLRGLDTGCVYHGNGRDGYLTAWVPSAAPDPFSELGEGLWQVPAKARYWRP